MRMRGRHLPPPLLVLLLLLGLAGALPGTAGDGGSPAAATFGKAAASEAYVSGRGHAPLQVRDERTTRPVPVDPADGHPPAAPGWSAARTGGAAWTPAGATPAALLLVAPGRGPPG